MTFFKNFPTIFYNGLQAENLMARARFTPETRKDIGLYYPYTIKDSDGRAEVLANNYYDDPYAVWMIYFANDVVDPFYGLGLNQEDFDAHIKKKYGSLETAQSSIAFYRTNWELLEDSSITLAEYDDLEPEEKKYWRPINDIYGTVSQYERKKEDLIVNTNRIIQMTVQDLEGEFKEGERINFYEPSYLAMQTNQGDVLVDENAEYLLIGAQDYNTIPTSSYGICVGMDANTVTIQHVFGANTTNVLDNVVIGKDTKASAVVLSATLLSENLPPTIQAKYWSPVSHYDNENEVNILKRNVKLVDKRFKGTVENELKRVMRK